MSETMTAEKIREATATFGFRGEERELARELEAALAAMPSVKRIEQIQYYPTTARKIANVNIVFTGGELGYEYTLNLRVTGT
jgi:hypothetical protein